MNNTLEAIAPYASKRISQMARADKEFVSLSIGEPWFGPVPVAADILSSLSASEIHSISSLLSRYGNGRGGDRLREVVATKYRKQFGVAIDPDKNVIITHGGSQAFLLSLLVATEEGDEVVVPDPTYMLYASTCVLLGRIPVRPPKSEIDGFVLSPAALKKAISGRTRLVVLNSPENPTGVVYSKAELKELYEICVEAGVVLLQDEVYDSFVFEGEHWSCTAFDQSLCSTIQLNSMSKRYGLPGLRIGWLIADERTISGAAKALEYIALSVSGPSHYLAEKILSDPKVDKWIDQTREQVRARRDMLRSAFCSLGFKFPPRCGCGGFFLFPNVTAVAGKLGDRQSVALGDFFADWIARTAKIAVVPGSIYGSQGRDHIRLVTTVGVDELQLAIDRFRTALGGVSAHGQDTSVERIRTSG